MSQDAFGQKALELACHYQNRCCEQEEIIEMFCLDAQAIQVERKPLELIDIAEWWRSDNGLEDCDMCKLDDFTKVVRAVESKLAARSKP